MKIILASASPRRKELLQQLGVDFTILPSNCPEIITKTLPHEVVLELATQKALDVANTYKLELSTSTKAARKDFLILGADTIVALGSTILGKPKSEAHAAQMLRALQGREHEVYTGVYAITNKNDTSNIYSFYERTKVTMFPMTDKEISEYIASKEPMDKAGAYAIQGLCAKYIHSIQGDYNNVVGLPIGRLWQEVLKQ